MEAFSQIFRRARWALVVIALLHAIIEIWTIQYWGSVFFRIQPHWVSTAKLASVLLPTAICILYPRDSRFSMIQTIWSAILWVMTFAIIAMLL
jgi:hypothetical protein